MKLCQFVLKILNRNKILTSIKGHNSVTNSKTNMTGENSNLDLVNVNAFIKNGQILSICSKDFEQKRNSNLSYDVASGSEITPCNKICKPLVVYRFSGNVMTPTTTLRT